MAIKWTLDKRKYLDSNEVKKLRKTLKIEMKRGIQTKNYILVRNWFVVLLGLYSGLRISEMADLRNEDILIYDDLAFVYVKKGKGNKKRHVRVGKELIEAYLEFTNFKKNLEIGIDDESYVLCKINSEKLSVRTLQIAFKKCASKAGLSSHYSIHCLRHTYGTHLYKASNHNLRFVQKQLGHSSISITEVYANVIEEEAGKAIDRLYK